MDSSTDVALQQVKQTLLGIPEFARRVPAALRQALDEVIDGRRTGRYCVEQLEKTEKTYIGTKVEIVLRDQLVLARGVVLDNLIAGHEVDTKFSLRGDWMIPLEAVGHLCLLVTVDEYRSTCRLGLLRVTPHVLRPGANQDSKRSISAQGKQGIEWLLDAVPMPQNLLLHLDEATRTHILSRTSGRQRVEALFTQVTGRLLPRAVVQQVIRLPGDPLKRAREAKAHLRPLGYRILCSAYKGDRAAMVQAGFEPIADDEWLSLPMEASPLP